MSHPYFATVILAQNIILGKKKHHPKMVFNGAVKQIRTADLVITNDVLYLLSYNSIMATEKGLEPSTSSVTG